MYPPLTTLADCQDFIENNTPSAIAKRLIHDQSLCRNGGIPSLLVHCLPSKSDPIARAMNEDDPIPLMFSRMRYDSIVSVIKNHLGKLEPNPGEIPVHMIPTDDEFNTTLKVLHYLQLPQVRSRVQVDIDAVERVADLVQIQLTTGPEVRTAMLGKQKQTYCYMCRFTILSAHKLYPSLCNPCGEFNVASCATTLPSSLKLHSKTALVTGARVNLGFYITLRLLRCGARVVATSRYPMDAEERYLKEPDSAEWKSRLRIIGADFRTAKDVFSLVETVLQCLEAWDTKKLDILINSAAQTLTDSLSKEEDGIRRESLLLQGATSKNADGGLVIDNAYAPQVRGGQVGHYLEASSGVAQRLIKNKNTDSRVLSPKESELSSWAQTISSVPYEDVISAHSVNTFVPFILLRELLPWMRRPKLSADVTATDSGVVKPYSYVINVSSREGLPEDKPNHSAKAGHHVHTNMSKAALNMLTETEAGPAWHSGKVAINSVDPGYMSADPMWMKMVGREGQACPIGWEDGVGRVLWVVAKGEIEGTPIWGRFLKHLGEIRSGR